MRRPGRTASRVADTPARDELRAAYTRQLRTAARESTLLAGVVAIVAFPAWAVFDYVLLPHKASTFLIDRIVFTAAIVLAWVALRLPQVGGRWPQQCAFVLLALPEVGIAWMIPRSPPHLEAYLLGFSLAIYASAFLIEWQWQLTASLVALTLAATAACTAATHPTLTAAQITTVSFYLGTAGTLAVVAQLYRYHAGWHRFTIEAALASEHNRNQALLAELSRLSHEDTLTGLPNRRAWEDRLADEVARARRQQTALSIIYCDFDHFKHVNDRNGHATGDAVLRAGAAVMRNRLRSTDYLARLGGDEFAIACPDTSLRAAALVANDLVAAAHAPVWPPGTHMTFSLGVAELHPDDGGTDELSSRADAALYRAKLTRDRACIQPARKRVAPFRGSGVHSTVER